MDKRFLITTSDERSWKTDEKILFLNEGCKKLSRKNFWSQLDYNVLPYHWDDPQRLHSDYQYLIGIYDKYLEILTQKLNKIHNVYHSKEYWRIIIGPWLQLFIGIIFDKWISILEAQKRVQISNTWILDLGEEELIPLGMNELQQFIYSDLWHHHIFSQIIISNNQIPYRKIGLNLSQENLEPEKKSKLSLKSSLINMANFFCRFIPDQFNKTVFISTNFLKLDLIKLQISLGQVPYVLDSIIRLENIPAHKGMRNDLEMNYASNEFEDILEILIPLNFPKLNLELYPELCNQVFHRFPKKVSTIVTTHGYWAEEGAKLWIAEKKEQGAKLVIGQHGGHFGSGLIEQSEVHQIQICDRFFTWGWKDPKFSQVRPLSPPKLASTIKKGIIPKENGSILWVWGAELPKFFYRMHSVPLSSQWLQYIYDQIEFAKNLSKEVLDITKLRLRPNGKLLWEEDLYFKEAGFQKIIDYSGNNLHEKLKKSRVCVTTDNSTVFLETFSINFPTILFWNPTHWQLRPSVKPIFEELKRVEILHDSPKSASKLINSIYMNPSNWWFKPERQRVIKSFCKEFACVRSSWLKEWKKELKALLSKN